jgi:integrase
MAEKFHLTKTSVEAIPAPTAGETIAWDDRLPGFGVRISPKGKRTYFVQARTKSRRQVKLKLGVHGSMTADRARVQANIELGKIGEGKDPAQERRMARAAETKRRAMLTVSQLCDKYLAEYAQTHKRASSVADDESMIVRIIKPRLGAKRVPDVERSDIRALHHELAEKPYAANRLLALLSKMFNLATVDWELRPDNPAKGIKKYDEPPRERYLDEDELGRLVDALKHHSNQVAANVVRMLLLTGARRGEVLGAAWNEFDLSAGVWTKPSAHTKRKRTHRVTLSAPMRSLLAEIKASQELRPSPYVFPGRIDNAPMTEIKKSWASILKAAQISGARVHDIRHTHASMLAGAGESLPVIGALLGHTQAQTTTRYVHLVDRAMRQATERVGAKLGALVREPDAPAEVIPLRQGNR